MPRLFGAIDEASLQRAGCGVTGFLFDENLPRRLTFAMSWPIVHASLLGESPTDSAIWHFARDRRLAIVSKDSDFSDRAMIATPPPWAVIRLHAFQATLAKVWPQVESLLPENKLICVYRDRIESFRS